MSPGERWQACSCWCSRSAWVPLPTPGGPRRISRHGCACFSARGLHWADGLCSQAARSGCSGEAMRENLLPGRGPCGDARHAAEVAERSLSPGGRSSSSGLSALAINPALAAEELLFDFFRSLLRPWSLDQALFSLPKESGSGLSWVAVLFSPKNNSQSDNHSPILSPERTMSAAFLSRAFSFPSQIS